MFSLVADYGDSEEESSTSESTNAEDSNNVEPEILNNQLSPLPSATAMLCNNTKIIPGGVFCNPFKAAEDAHIANLEKHVKMVDPEQESGDQKRKICWNYKKGRCRFGSKCNFAHGSDLIMKQDRPGSHPETDGDDLPSGERPSVALEQIQTSRKQTNKKKRPGLSKDLVPPKKVLRMYQREKYSGKH
ncbi:uncharacterized protein LOC129771442 [Toxorhynchites rutilus septentrionalis]|uniref:uncharacterized protein LOC129771442 n=1 Tax=Toxorhynchites rutilus septentrionalis TaxID=329112 RepID=UPI00247991D5|nr:uncharacterized protein LOC129771442 [Toxorhynchites rutilus septentrionalis]